MDEPTISALPDEPEKVTKKPRKRKIDKVEKRSPELRKKARALCSSVDEWHTISSNNDAQLSDYIDEKMFLEEHSIHRSVDVFVLSVMAKFADYLFGGDGHVEFEMINDEPLLKSISIELSFFIHLMNNKIRLAALVGKDIVNGKKKEILCRPVINEESNNPGADNTEQLVQSIDTSQEDSSG